MKRVFALLAVLMLLTGCAGLQNVSVSDLRNEKNKVAEGEIQAGIPQIQQAIYDYAQKCRDIGQISVNPANPTEAQYVAYGPGWTEASAMLLIDIEQVGNVSKYRGYVYYITWKRHVDKTISIMKGQATC